MEVGRVELGPKPVKELDATRCNKWVEYEAGWFYNLYESQYEFSNLYYYSLQKLQLLSHQSWKKTTMESAQCTPDKFWHGPDESNA